MLQEKRLTICIRLVSLNSLDSYVYRQEMKEAAKEMHRKKMNEIIKGTSVGPTTISGWAHHFLLLKGKPHIQL